MPHLLAMLKVIGLILTIIGLLAVVVWALRFPEYQACLEQTQKDDADCMEDYLLMHPQIQEVQEIQKACEKSDTACLLKVGESAVTQKLEDAATKSGEREG